MMMKYTIMGFLALVCLGSGNGIIAMPKPILIPRSIANPISDIFPLAYWVDMRKNHTADELEQTKSIIEKSFSK